jgi:hypothetical protein
MAELWLVCEGEPRSVDVALLQRVFADVLAAEIVVEPACGSNPSPVARFLETHRGGKAAFVHDRDYRPRSEAEAALVDGKPGFLWPRHSIENYLLPPPIILRAFQNLRERFEHQRPGRVPRWIAALPSSPEEVTQALCECARRRAAEEACRLATYRLWDTLPLEARRVQKRNPIPPGTDDPGDWREALCLEAERICRAAVQTAECEKLRREAIAALFDETYAGVTTDAYVKEMEFLIDFHGRDLLKAFHQWLGSRETPPFYDTLCRELISAAVQQYEVNRTIYGKDDFRNLANAVRALAGLTPLA